MVFNSNVLLAVSHYVCPADVTLLTFLDRVTEAGFERVGLTVKALNEMPLAKLRAELKARGLGVSSVNTAGYFFQSHQANIDQADLNLRLLDAAAELEASNGVNLIVGSRYDQPLVDIRQQALEKSIELAAQAKSRGTRLLLEPMHPLQAGAKGCVNTLAQAAGWLAAVPDLWLNVDLYHSWWDPDLERVLTGQLGRVAVFQICDVVTAMNTNLPSRAPLGEGFIDWPTWVMQVATSYPEIPIELEWFADQMPDRDWLSMMRSDAQKMQMLKRGMP